MPNHTSWFDWIFLFCALDDDWRFVTSSTTAQASFLHRYVMLNWRTFPVDPASPYAVKRMAEFLEKGGKLLLFSEGRISMTGSLGKIFDGAGFLLSKTKARVICCYLRGANRLPMSPNTDKKNRLQRVTAHFSDILAPPQSESQNAEERRRALSDWLRDQLLLLQFNVEQEYAPKRVLDAVVQTACKFPKREILEDATGQTLTYRELLTGTALFRKAWANLPPDPAPIGVLLPTMNASALVFLSLWSTGRIPAPLNYSSGAVSIASCIQLSKMKHVITSRAFLERAAIDMKALAATGVQFIYLEDLKKTFHAVAKLGAFLKARFSPRTLCITETKTEDTGAILFTSGSEGVPKGVMLSHANLMTNIHQMLVINDFQDTDRLFNCLPIFHSFSFTVGTLLPLVRGIFTYLYPSPIHYRIIPALFYDKNCTILLGTNTFLNGYARRAHPYDFRSLRYLFAGAEKIQDATADVWARRFGVRILQAYGTTECSPAIAANTPLAPKHGSVGRFVPGMEFRLEPLEGIDEGGRLFVRGPNVMKGYLNKEADAAFKSLNGWYDTGDIVSVDAHGFIEIKGRLKRFAKISGEMVSLTAVEEALAAGFPQFGSHFQIAILTKPDPEKGEALVAVTNESRLKVEALRPVIQAKGLSNLAVPVEVKVVPEIPKLGTGKVDYRALESAK